MSVAHPYPLLYANKKNPIDWNSYNSTFHRALTLHIVGTGSGFPTTVQIHITP